MAYTTIETNGREERMTKLLSALAGFFNKLAQDTASNDPNVQTLLPFAASIRVSRFGTVKVLLHVGTKILLLPEEYSRQMVFV